MRIQGHFDLPCLITGILRKMFAKYLKAMVHVKSPQSSEQNEACTPFSPQAFQEWMAVASGERECDAREAVPVLRVSPFRVSYVYWL